MGPEHDKHSDRFAREALPGKALQASRHVDQRVVTRSAAAAMACLRRVGTALLDSYAPQLCLFCDLPSDSGEPVCEPCLAELPRNHRACPRCALPDCGEALCPRCLRGKGPPCRVIAPFIYDSAIAYLLKSWKYEKQRRLAPLTARLALFADSGDISAQMVLPAPLHWRRRLQRGFNQSEDLLDAMAKKLSRLEHLRRQSHRAPRLVRCRATPKQSLASRGERLRNLAGAFEMRGELNGEPVLIIDDVCTTGATATAMTRALHDAGAGDVTLWCIARTPS